jgi:hypothetical protein
MDKRTSSLKIMVKASVYREGTNSTKKEKEKLKGH